MWHVTCDMWHVTRDTWHMPHMRSLSGGVERGTNERPGIWSCDLWANERPPRGKKEKKQLWHLTRDSDTWHVTCDMWHMTCDTWHVTHDTWHMTGRVSWNFFKIVGSLALTGLMGQWEVILCQPLRLYRQFHKVSLNQSISEWRSCF